MNFMKMKEGKVADWSIWQSIFLDYSLDCVALKETLALAAAHLLNRPKYDPKTLVYLEEWTMV